MNKKVLFAIASVAGLSLSAPALADSPDFSLKNTTDITHKVSSTIGNVSLSFFPM
jgi:hypothetical protein